jgi:hypothetical protein
MEDPVVREQAPADRLDADLVCEQCGTVNQPGTLYCHSCGNNLREQRLQRLAEGDAVVMEAGPDRSRLLLGAVSVAGLLLVLYVAWNVNAIAEWMVGAQPRIDTNIYWQGPLASDFEALAAALRTEPLTGDQVRASYDTPTAITSYEGRFVVRQVLTVVERTLGQAISTERDGVILFVVLMESGAEVRGTARVEEGGRLTSSSIAYAIDGRTIGGVGFAVPHPEGGYSATGVSDFDDRPFSLRIYRAN